jgi:hypothetical protein
MGEVSVLMFCSRVRERERVGKCEGMKEEKRVIFFFSGLKMKKEKK